MVRTRCRTGGGVWSMQVNFGEPQGTVELGGNLDYVDVA